MRFDTYLLWEVGKPADFALEIGSPSTARNDLMSKRALYARPGIGEYWRHDKTGGNFYGEPLVGKYLEDGEYQRLEMHRGGQWYGVGPQPHTESRSVLG